MDARHVSSNTDQSAESWPLETLATQLPKEQKNAFDLLFAYAHAKLDNETVKLIEFSSGDEFFDFIGYFCGLKSLGIFFTPQMSLFFKNLIRQVSALLQIDDILLMSNSKLH